MEIRIQAIHFDIAEKLTDFVNRKAEKLTRRYPAVSDIDVNLKLIKPETSLNKEATLKIHVPQQSDIVATKTADTFEEAVDLCLEAVERQLEKLKSKK